MWEEWRMDNLSNAGRLRATCGKQKGQVAEGPRLAPSSHSQQGAHCAAEYRE
jgi:hypothetical protein